MFVTIGTLPVVRKSIGIKKAQFVLLMYVMLPMRIKRQSVDKKYIYE